MANYTEKCALLPPRASSSKRRRSSSPAHCGRLAAHQQHNPNNNYRFQDSCAIPSASTISEALHFSSSPVSFVNHRRFSVAPCPKLPDNKPIAPRAIRSNQLSSNEYFSGYCDRRRRQSSYDSRQQFYAIKPSASSPQAFPTLLDTNPNWGISPLHPLIAMLEQNSRITSADRKLSFDSASALRSAGTRPPSSLNKYELAMSSALSNEPISLPHHINSTTAFQSMDSSGKRKVFGTGYVDTAQSPSTVRIPGMASPLPENKNLNASMDQKNPFYEVSNEYMRVAGYVQQFNRLFSIKKAKADGEPSDVEGGDVSYKNLQTKDAIGNGVPEHGKPSQGTVYGRLWKEQPNLKRFKFRKQLLMQRTRACNLCLLFAVTGIVLTIVEAELTANNVIQKTDFYSKILRYIIVFTTVVLLLFIVWYHAIEIKVCVIDSGAHDWRVAITGDRVLQLCIELLVCAVCPFPNTITIDWIVLKENYRQIKTVQVPLDVVLSIPMFTRCYLLCRFMALHSRQFQDAATRSIASLNRVTVNFTFVLKTLMHEYPVLVLCSFTISFWIVMAWLLTQCERYDEVKEDNNYLNALWFIMITFKSVGYGDLVPNTYCGRVLAITTGIVGAAVSSALIAVIGMKLELSRAEKHVNNFMTDSKLTRLRKETAAMVLQHTWFIHKYRRLQSTKDEIKLRFHQRKFLAAINEFRKIKWDQRKLAEQGNALVDLAKLQNDMHTMIWSMQQTLDNLANQMSTLTQHINHLYELNILQHANILNNAELLRREGATADKNVEQRVDIE